MAEPETPTVAANEMSDGINGIFNPRRRHGYMIGKTQMDFERVYANAGLAASTESLWIRNRN